MASAHHCIPTGTGRQEWGARAQPSPGHQHHGGILGSVSRGPIRDLLCNYPFHNESSATIVFYLQCFSPLFTGCSRVRLRSTFLCSLPGSGQILRAAGLSPWGQYLTSWALRVLLFACSIKAPQDQGIPTAPHRARDTPQPGLSRGAVAALGGPKGFLWKGEESGCRLSHRVCLSAVNNTGPLPHFPSPRQHRALAAAPCPAARSWHPPRGSGRGGEGLEGRVWGVP